MVGSRLIKRTNAVLSILITVLLFVHAGYESISLCMMYYQSLLSKITGFLIAGTVAVHAVISAVCVFVLHDSKSVLYLRLNLRTVIQRICAILMVVLLPVHIFAFDLLKGSAGSFGYILTEAAQLLFYGALFAHIAVSFGNSLVTLGKLEKETTRRRLDVILAVICLLLFLVMSVITITTHVKMFYGDRI